MSDIIIPKRGNRAGIKDGKRVVRVKDVPIPSKLSNVKVIYCRKCMKKSAAKNFYEACDVFLDINGKMSVCKYCIEDIYQRFMISEGSMDRAFLKLCKALNVKFDPIVFESTRDAIEKLESRGKVSEATFGIYRAHLKGGGKNALADKLDLTYVETTRYLPDDSLVDYEQTDLDYLAKFWGTNFTAEDYEFLEEIFSEWKKTHKCDTRAEETLLKEICHVELKIRKARIEDKSTASLVKELQDLMKTANVDPAKASLANAGKSQDTFSSFIKTIEENEPADFYKDKDLFKDFDNLDWYFKKYVTRPLKNFIQIGSRDFDVSDNDFEDEIEDDIFSEEN